MLENKSPDFRTQAYFHLDDSSLANYIRFAWADVEPNETYMHNWHIDAICEHLEAVTSGQITKLIVNMPPRFMKSTLISVMWPTWEWTKKPYSKFLYSSYAGNLAVRDNIKSRLLIQSAWYQSLFGNRFKLVTELQEKIQNDKNGYRLAASVGGSATGEGGDRVVSDDPHKIEEIESDTVRQGVLDWWDQTMNTRLNNPKLSARVITMQRLHEEDLVGHLLATNQGYVHLCLPMEYEGQKYFTPINWTNPFTGVKEKYGDPRTKEGELLFPKRYGPKEVQSLKTELLDYGYASKYQQQPIPKGGAMFHRNWFKSEKALPIEIKKSVRYWDKAGTAGGGAFTVGVRMVILPNNIVIVEDVVRAQVADLEREEMIKQTAQMDRLQRPNTEIWIEQEPGSGGKDAAAATIRNLAGYPVYTERPTGDKMTRASPLAAYAKAGNVYILEADWNEAFLREFEFFPRGKYKDQVDASSGAFNKLFKGGFAYNVGG